jgi:hypothetical protein
MNRIRPWLYIGNYEDTMDLHGLRQHGIQTILQLAIEVYYPQIDTHYIHVFDGERLPMHKLERGLQIIRDHHTTTMLIACAAGISRSATFCIAALKETENLGLLEAYREVKNARPFVQPHPALWKSLSAYYGESIPYEALFE